MHIVLITWGWVILGLEVVLTIGAGIRTRVRFRVVARVIYIGTARNRKPERLCGHQRTTCVCPRSKLTSVCLLKHHCAPVARSSGRVRVRSRGRVRRRGRGSYRVWTIFVGRVRVGFRPAPVLSEHRGRAQPR